MAVTAADSAILIVDTQFGVLVTADFSAIIDRLLLSSMVTARSIRAAALYVPATIGVGDNMVGIRSFIH